MHRNKQCWEDDNPKPIGHSKSSSEREAHSSAISPQETRKSLELTV